MKQRKIILITLFILLLARDGFSATNELLVKFNNNSQSKIQAQALAIQPVAIEPLFIQAIVQNKSGRPVGRTLITSASTESTQIFKLTFSEDVDIEEAAKTYKALPEVDFAEPNQTFEIQSDIESYVPNDTGYENQWALNKIEAQKAWAISQGSNQVVIAVLDTGIDYKHEDLANNIWQNTQEIPNNGQDDDGNGFIDDVKGWDFVDVAVSSKVATNEDGQTEDNEPDDKQGHGTHLAGIIAAQTNNQLGISGLAGQCQVMAVRVGYLTSSGSGAIELDDAARGIKYAVDNGARVLNLSFGGYVSQTLDLMLQYAADNGVVVVAAAGNEGKANIIYPASRIDTIAVGATDGADLKASWSNTGSQLVLTAPGSQIYSTLPGNQYGYKSGTSMATAFVAASAALLLSKMPTLSVAEVRNILTETSEDLGASGFDTSYGYGRINVFKALTKISPQVQVQNPEQTQEQTPEQTQNNGQANASQPIEISAKLISDILFAPNPFRPKQSTAYVCYTLSQPASVKLYIHALNGDLIYSTNQEELTNGDKQIEWSGVDNFGETVASGAYFGYLLVNGNGQSEKKLVKIALLR